MYTMLSDKQFNKIKAEHGKKVALKVAKQSVGKIRAKSKAGKPMVIKAKSALTDRKMFMAEYIFSNNLSDSAGDTLPTHMLVKQLNGMLGDFEHTNLFDYGFDDRPLFRVVDSHFDSVNLVGLVQFNTEHDQFPFVWEKTMDGEGGISIEYYEDMSGITGLTWTIKPENERCQLIAGYEMDENKSFNGGIENEPDRTRFKESK